MNSRSRKQGFTLIELLVVIAIIALLLAIIMPSLQKVKQIARSVICCSNMRQMGIGFASYGVQNDGRMFSFGYKDSDDGDGYWFRRIAPYLGDDDFRYNDDLQTSGIMKIAICPSTKIDTSNGGGNAKDNKSTWYYESENIIGSCCVNAWVLPDPDGEAVDWGLGESDVKKRLFNRWANIRGEVGLVADSFRLDNWPSTPPDVDIPSESELLEPGDLSHNIKQFMLRYMPDRHGGANSIVYVDGSAEKIKLKDLYTVKWNNYDGMKVLEEFPER